VLSSKGYMVGEQGPEWFSPGSSGNITPNHKLGGAAPVTNISIDARGAQEGVADQIVYALKEYDRQMPARVQQISNDPRAK